MHNGIKLCYIIFILYIHYALFNLIMDDLHNSMAKVFTMKVVLEIGGNGSMYFHHSLMHLFDKLHE